jgi:hypothetical protein
MWIQRNFAEVQIVMLGLALTGCELGVEDEPSESERSVPADGGGEPPPQRCRDIDDWEPNPSAAKATKMTGDTQIIEAPAYLCPGEEDWYLFETDLGYAQPNFTVIVLVKNEDFCQCQGPILSPGPEHALTVETYRADTMELLDTRTDDDGQIGFGNIDVDYGHNVFVRVLSPTKAEYPYRLSASIFDGPTGDDCEC